MPPVGCLRQSKRYYLVKLYMYNKIFIKDKENGDESKLFNLYSDLAYMLKSGERTKVKEFDELCEKVMRTNIVDYFTLKYETE